jgi:hypothetical protein
MLKTRLATAVLAAALASTLAGAAFAQAAPPTVIRGSIVSVDGNVLTIKGATSTSKVTLADDARLGYVVKSDISKITAGMFIGTAAVPQADGSYRALEIQLFNQAAHPGETDRPWDIAPQSTMTNATISTMTSTTVDKVEGRVLVLKIKDADKRVFVPLSAPVVEFEPATRAALVPGASVLLFAAKKDDGSLTAASIQIGKAGLVIPY